MLLPDYDMSRLLQRKLTGIRRTLFVVGAEAESKDGPLELHFEGSVVALLDGGPEGERIRIRWAPWLGPFDGVDDSPQNEAYIRKHGKWTRFDMSRSPEFRPLVGQALTSFGTLKDEHGVDSGVELTFGETTFWFAVEGDECHVYWAHPIGMTRSRPGK